jgi:hypothetical protein
MSQSKRCLFLSAWLLIAGCGTALADTRGTQPTRIAPPVEPPFDRGAASLSPAGRAGTALPRASVGNVRADVQFMGIGYADTKALGHGLTPPDMGGAASAGFVMQMVNGGAAIFTTAGALVNPVMTDVAFWKKAGVPGQLTSASLSDPRTVYDAKSGRFFICELTLGGPSPTHPAKHNAILFAVSKSSNPADGFTAFAIPVKAGTFADFPTLGVNADVVTISTNNFGLHDKLLDLSVFTLPKADLLGANPSIARLQTFDGISADAYGGTLHAVDSQNPSSRTQAILGTGKGLHQLTSASLIAAGQSGASLSAPATIFAGIDGYPAPARQPVGRYDGGDNRISAQISQVGDFIYFANEVSDDQGAGGAKSDYVHWGIVQASTNTLVAEGRIIDPSRAIDYSYPAIDANSSGRFVIAYAGSSTTSPISAYATVCDFDTVRLAANCGAPKTIAVGLDGSFHLFSPNRWGDYSAIQVDPDNPDAFWLYQEIPGAKIGSGSAWATVITHLQTQ